MNEHVHVIVDWTLLAIRALRAVPDHPIRAVLSYLHQVVTAIEPRGFPGLYRPSWSCTWHFAQDGPGATAARKVLLSSYKKHRKRPKNVKNITDLERQVKAVLPSCWWQVAGAEADDVGLWLVRELRPAKIVLVTTDRDWWEALRHPDVQVWDLDWRRFVLDKDVRQAFPVSPKAIPFWKVLFGDPSDGIGPVLPGLPAARMAWLVERLCANVDAPTYEHLLGLFRLLSTSEPWLLDVLRALRQKTDDGREVGRMRWAVLGPHRLQTVPTVTVCRPTDGFRRALDYGVNEHKVRKLLEVSDVGSEETPYLSAFRQRVSTSRPTGKDDGAGHGR